MNRIRLRLLTVDYFLLMEFLSAALFVFGLFVVVCFVVVLFDDLDHLREHGVSFGLGMAYVLLRLPHEVIKATPMVVVLSVVLTVSSLVRNNEMLMLNIAGYSPLRLAAPFAVTLGILILAIVYLNEQVSGPFAARAHTIMETRIKAQQDQFAGFHGNWLYGDRDRLYYAKNYNPATCEFTELSVFEFRGRKGALSTWYEAGNAKWEEEADLWTLRDVTVHLLDTNGSIKRDQSNIERKQIGYTPQQLTQVMQDPEQMSHADLAAIVDKVREAGEDPRDYLCDLRIKEAFPFAVFFLGMLTFSMALRLKGGGRASGIGLGLMAVIVYFMLLSMGKSIGQAGAVPPWLGAWGPNLICFVISIYEFNRLQQES